MRAFSSKRLRNAIVLLGVAVCLLISAPHASAQSNPSPQQPAAPNWPPPKDGDFAVKDFRFGSGEVLAQMNLHYATLGTPQRDAAGRVTNAVLILHGTGGTGRQFLQPQFAGELFGPGQLLDAARYFIILPDNIGHGRSSKPSDGFRAKYPHYDYDDMVRAQHLLLTEGLGVNHLRLVMGTSMGCMHSFVWGEMFPDFLDALMPLACLPVEIAGRNRIWRKMSLDAIRTDPEWLDGNYAAQPRGLRTSLYLLQLVGLAPMQAQKNFPTRAQADKNVDDFLQSRFATTDANDFLYQVDSSRNYNPSPQLEKILTPMMYINSADDFINPPELAIAEREITKVKRGRFILIPISDETRGHGTHTRARVWKQYLEDLLKDSAK